eukprot:TRINITY_DN48382_c0_g1_i1.p1 TRINITY_DN48382_c0_g1~~TRINITY_DN48382_c0_g1_i1.p1  ORF type:complete len:283 (+),score=59.52 TRINITY_DN48382_c0_g1_i1:107-955(+)
MSSAASNLKEKCAKQAPPSQVLSAYVIFLTCAAGMYYLVANGEFSAILTVAVMFQCLGFGLLAVQVALMGRTTGISARAIGLDLLALCLRLASTTQYHGYLPVDASGDFLYQATDFVSLCLVIWLLYECLVGKKWSYQEEEDSMPIAPVVIGCIFLALIFHADMNARPLFDTFWMSGLLISAVAVMPQLWLISKTGGKVEPLTCHYIAAMAFGRALSGIFMWHARFDITCNEWVKGYNHALWAILGAHLLHLLLLGDFSLYYIKTMITNGLNSPMNLAEEMV